MASTLLEEVHGKILTPDVSRLSVMVRLIKYVLQVNVLSRSSVDIIQHAFKIGEEMIRVVRVKCGDPEI